MFEAVRSSRIFVQIVLAVIILTFAFFGIESYLGGIGNDGTVATVGETTIGPAEFENALRRQQDQIREQTGGQVELAQLNSPAIREAVLEGLVNQRLLALYASESRLSVSVGQLQQIIGSIDEFKVDGEFSRNRYEQVLRSQGLSEPAFEAQLRRDAAFQQVTTALGNGALAPMRTAKALLAMQVEQRSVALGQISADALLEGLEVSDGEIAEYYEQNKASFELPARVKAAYVVLDREQFAKRVKPTEEQVREWYDGHPERYRQPEERQARHILIELAADASDADVEAATAKANKILEELRADDGKNFAEVAKAQSQDPGSAAQGGDLGYFGRGAMLKPFEEAVFSLTEGQISDVVRTDFGLHIIQLTGIHPEKVKPFEDVKTLIETELREQGANTRFAEAAETFSNVVYEQPDGLEPAADEFELEIQTSDWMNADGTYEGPFASQKLLKALFNADSLERKLNTEAVDLGNGRLAAARIVDYKAPEIQALEAVREPIAALLKERTASELAEKKGQEAVAALREGSEDAVELAEPVTLTRRSSEVALDVLRGIFTLETGTLPAFGGVRGSDGNFHVFRVDSVTKPEIADGDERLAAIRGQYERLLAERDLKAFLAELRRKYGVEVNRSALQAVAS